MVSTSQPLATQTSTAKRFQQITRLLFYLGMAGQWLFAYYIVAFYGGVVMNGTYEKVNEQLPHGIIEGDTMGNMMLAMHLGLAAIITFGGPLQFFPSLRKRFPKFHRWNGRIFYFTAFLVTLAGLYMIITRPPHGGATGFLGNALNATLILWFGTMAWRTAMQKDFVAHRKWAIRAFLMVSGVWFFRVGYGLWILLTAFKMPGTTANLDGPFDIFLSFGHSLVPLLIGEYYLWARAHDSPQVKKRASFVFGTLCLLLAGGIVMLSLVFWLPLLS
ncbi:MAG: DUF2306 domain-containing protein [Bacteroidota bacterium]